MWYLYILKCENSILYTGVTNNLDRRLLEHSKSKGGQYTKLKKPNKLLYFEKYPERTAAFARERQIKRWSKAKKTALAEKNFQKLMELSKSKYNKLYSERSAVG